MKSSDALTTATYDLARSDFLDTIGHPGIDVRSKPVWRKIRDLGTHLWLDTGNLEEAERLWCEEFTALTTNNTLLNQEIQTGLYDDLVPKAAEVLREVVSDIDEQQMILEIAFVLNAYHALKLVDTFDAWVSVEVHTDLAHDVERTVAYGQRFYDICPERFIIKIPFTPAGLLAANTLSTRGIPVNMTLGFSTRQNVLAALLAEPAYVNVFMGRLNAYVVDNGLGDGRNVGEKATLATQRALRDLRDADGTDTRVIGASMRDSGQVGALAGLDVYTMPLKVVDQYEKTPLSDPALGINNDPEVLLKKGTVTGEGLNTLWEVSDVFQDAVDRLVDGHVESLSPESIPGHFADLGIKDLFPSWTPEDVAAAEHDGKIPLRARWHKRLAAGDIGLDALMNLSALRAFTRDQRALDERIISLLNDD